LYSYRAYGFGISSELYLPELSSKSNEADIEIRYGHLDHILDHSVHGEVIFWSKGVETYFYFKDVGAFFLHQRREIIVDPVPGADKRLIRLYLLGKVFGALLHQRGLLVLHGSALVMHGGAAAFLGHSGSGKSTAVAFLMEKSDSMIADDLVVIDSVGSVPIVYPGFPQLRLWPDVAESLGYSADEMPYNSSRKTKYSAIFASNFLLDPFPLRRIYILDKGERVEIKPLEIHESMIELLRYSYPVRSLNAGLNIKPHFSQCSNVANYVPICRLIRPFDLKFMPDFISAVDEDIKYAIADIKNRA
jgi:hypothetical protein